MAEKKGANGRLTALMALRLAAPDTWAASVLPVVFAAALAFGQGARADLPLLLSLAAASVLMQAAVNTFNDYSDFIKGTDTLANSPDAADAVLLYAAPEPKKVLILGAAYLALAALAGIPAVLKCGWKPLAIGAAGGVCVLIYSFGKKPLSYLPLGELVSGFVMGGLIPLTVYGVLTGDFTKRILLISLPLIFGIGLIMMTNNTCDIARDTAAGRRTFAVLMGARRALICYRALLTVWLLLPLAFLGAAAGLIYLLALLSFSGRIGAQLKLPLSPEVRGRAMSGIVFLNSACALGYTAALILHVGCGI